MTRLHNEVLALSSNLHYSRILGLHGTCHCRKCNSCQNSSIFQCLTTSQHSLDDVYESTGLDHCQNHCKVNLRFLFSKILYPKIRGFNSNSFFHQSKLLLFFRFNVPTVNQTGSFGQITSPGYPNNYANFDLMDYYIVALSNTTHVPNYSASWFSVSTSDNSDDSRFSN